jgi:hypothetical protein
MLVQVAVAALVLVGFMVFVVDYGLQWLARAQAQNAADAGALAGALARAYDEPLGLPLPLGKTYQSAVKTAQANPVWGEPGAIQVSYPCPALGGGGDVGGAGAVQCVRVDVYRNGEFGSTPLPMIFGPVLGVSSQGVRATATALVGVGNATDCMRPFAVADKWLHRVSPLEEYNRWVKEGGAAVELKPSDLYIQPGPAGPGSGYRVPDDIGTYRVLKGGNNPMSDVDPITPGWFLPVQLPDGEGGWLNGADNFREAIANCVGQRVRIGQYLPTEEGAMVGPTAMGVEELVAQDPKAKFNPVTKTVEGSCAPGCAPISPRIVPITIFNMDEFQYRRAANDWSVCPSGGRCVKVVNILGFFVVGMSGSDIPGYLMTLPGEFSVGDPTVGAGASFLKTIQLIR